MSPKDAKGHGSSDKDARNSRLAKDLRAATVRRQQEQASTVRATAMFRGFQAARLLFRRGGSR